MEHKMTSNVVCAVVADNTSAPTVYNIMQLKSCLVNYYKESQQANHVIHASSDTFMSEEK